MYKNGHKPQFGDIVQLDKPFYNLDSGTYKVLGIDGDSLIFERWTTSPILYKAHRFSLINRK